MSVDEGALRELTARNLKIFTPETISACITDLNPDHVVWPETESLMAYEASYEERQEDEVDFLQAVFPGDFHDLRVNDSWKVHTRQRHR